MVFLDNGIVMDYELWAKRGIGRIVLVKPCKPLQTDTINMNLIKMNGLVYGIKKSMMVIFTVNIHQERSGVLTMVYG